MIKSVKAENFQSWASLEFDVQNGITLITGYNYDDNTAEGAGKSAILNAICWGLFGEIPKDTKMDDVIKQGEKSCFVKVELSNGLVVQRSRKPNDLTLTTESGTIRGKDIKETQKLVERYSGFTYETFLQSVYFAQNSLVKFILLNEDGKAKILSQIADLSSFDEARKKAHDLAREANLKYMVESNKVNDLEQAIKLTNDQISSLRDIRIKFEFDKSKSVANLELKIEDIKKQIELVGYIPELTADYYMKLSELRSTAKNYAEETIRLKTELAQQSQKQVRKNSLEVEIKRAKEEIAFLQHEQQDHSCQYCGSVLKSKEKQQYIQNRLKYAEDKSKELESLNFTNTKELEEQYCFYEETSKSIQQDLKEIEVLETEVKHKKEKLTMLGIQLEQTKKELEALRNREYPDIDRRIELLQTSMFQKQHERESTGKQVEQLTNTQKMYETIKDGLKEVKSLSFQQLLNELNERTNYYLNELFDQSISIVFSNIGTDGETSKIETILTIAGEPRKLGLFSGGQTRRIMLAVDLAISDIIHSRKGLEDRLLILDEYFKDLSQESIEKICKLLSSLNKNVIMIEHNTILRSLANNVINVEYKNGESMKA
jgi:DNA repair exonuclease SbcCD ATPase subunit